MTTTRPTLEEARTLAAGYSLVPVSRELFSDAITPIEALAAIRSAGAECFLLESAPGGDNWSRWTFIGYSPTLTVTGDAEGIAISRADGASNRKLGDTHALLRALTASYRSPRLDRLPPFTGGFVGYFSYEYLCRVEPSLKLSAADDVGYDDFRLMLFDKVIAFDSFRQKLVLIANAPADGSDESYYAAVAALDEMERVLFAERGSLPPPKSGVLGGFTATKTREEFVRAVETAKRHIFEGDIFQCVPSVRFSAPYGGDLFDAYRVLRTVNPSAYMFYVRFADLQLAGASPETLVSLKDGVATTYPLAGTCPRTDDDAETDALIEKLLSDEKELSEHDMLVDLGRNDLGRVCKFGTVKTSEYRTVKKLSHVCHIASKVTGRVRDDVLAPDVLAAALPAGTLSGAPKKRACEIVDALEGVRRGAYGGAVGYFDFAGNMDFCIGIRMAVLKAGRVYVQAGAGIVADSVPDREYDECVRKAEAMMNALTLGGATS
ncbi:MAG: chorismate-binding protein [Oscillospiraceae bacterium]|jgi:anthranilate synthase component 1|nr:chorismate-binding protein [Oscillospiraceae bacterium]